MNDLSWYLTITEEANEIIRQVEVTSNLSESTSERQIKTLSELPAATVEHLKRLITKAASLKRGSNDEDIPDHWTNALELVHWAYDASKVDRPVPSMRASWAQYSDIIHHAVKMLARFRGLEGSWRISTLTAPASKD
jgi:hypothetical protein